MYYLSNYSFVAPIYTFYTSIHNTSDLFLNKNWRSSPFASVGFQAGRGKVSLDCRWLRLFSRINYFSRLCPVGMYPQFSQPFWNFTLLLNLKIWDRKIGCNFLSSRSPFTCDSKQRWRWWGFSWRNRCIYSVYMLSMARIQHWQKIRYSLSFSSSLREFSCSLQSDQNHVSSICLV